MKIFTLEKNPLYGTYINVTTKITSVYNHGQKPIHKLTVNEFIHKLVANDPTVFLLSYTVLYTLYCVGRSVLHS